VSLDAALYASELTLRVADADLVVVARAHRQRAITVRGLARALSRGLVLLVLLAVVYVALARTGVIRSALFPKLDGDIALAESDRPGLRVLFVGNSFTYYNSMPRMVHELAEGDPGAAPVFSVEYTAPNWSLDEASENDGLADGLEDFRWDVVVLQDVSWHLSASPEERRRLTYPYARDLWRSIAENGAETMLFMTWGYKNGAFEGDTFEAMQVRLAEGYSELADELSADVAPVGLAWQEALRRRPGLELWKRDGGHPSTTGSYLAACVFYAGLTGQDPRGSSYTDGLDLADARFLQDVAHDVVVSEAP
jgi:hypothetical protein